jgi:cytochrome c2
MISRFAVAASLAVALAACGSSNQPSGQATGAAGVPSEVVTPASEAAPAEAATPSSTPSATTIDSDEHKSDDEDKDKDKKDSDEQDEHSASPPQAFNQCAACHSTEPGKTIIGPSLAGVYGHKAGQIPGFQFSDAMKNSGMVLNAANLDKFLADPKGTVPGTIMAFAGLKEAGQRKAVIDYLKTLK